MNLISDKYTFGFTAASLRLRDFITVSRLKSEGKDIDHLNLLGGGKSSTGKRMISEYEKRLSFLTEGQKELLINSILPVQKQIAFLAVCKTYSFIRDFTIEVAREKVLLFDYELTDGMFNTFLRRKIDMHPELEEITDKTTYKIRQVTFKIFEEAGIIDNIKEKMIQPQLVDKDVLRVIVNDNKEWLKILLFSDTDINNA